MQRYIVMIADILQS